MALTVDASDAPRILRLTIEDEWPRPDEQSTWRKTMIAGGKITAETRTLIDIRGMTQLPKYEELQDIIAGIVRDGGWPLHRAFLTATSAQFGVARQLQLMAPQSLSVEVFDDVNEAEAWLNA